MAPFRELFYDLVLSDENSQQKKPGRRISSSKLFKYSAFDNPEANIPSSAMPPPQAEGGAEGEAHADEERMEESDDPDIDPTEPPDLYPNLGYRERDRFPSNPDESSMEEGLNPSSGEEEAESEPTEHSGGARPKIPARQPATKGSYQ